MTDPAVPGLAPSNSTAASTVGAGVAAILFIVLKQFKIEVDAVSAAAIGGAISAALGYFFEGGRK